MWVDSGQVDIKTPSDSRSAEPDAYADDEPADFTGAIPVLTPELESYQGRSFNVALYRIINGKGGVIKSLSVITGLSPQAIKSRIARVRVSYADQEVDLYANDLEPDEARYMQAHYKDFDDPAVRDFIQAHAAPLRRRPDVRSSADAA